VGRCGAHYVENVTGMGIGNEHSRREYLNGMGRPRYSVVQGEETLRWPVLSA